ncbi:hypothetical protein OXYTRIMIC_135 [Oxytricha trifallax]|uniref:Uncharacterized protein n=1 Tax=Oxytricha trifallax TaxID=1172189 RepID=A0A073IBN5_9SPIT|nr:hypothetical protein OXYTRIMIC_135 [Oxytricha trifallax]
MLADKERKIRISDIRKQCWKTFIEKGRELTLEDLVTPIQQCFMDKIGRQTKEKKWYERLLERFVKSNGNKTYSAFEDTKVKWKEAIIDLEKCLDRNDLKGFFQMFKILIKNQMQAQPIKGITIKQERLEPGEEKKEESRILHLTIQKNRQCKSKETSKKDAIMIDEEQKGKFCEEQEVEKSIREFNFNNCISPDRFDGEMLLKLEKILCKDQNDLYLEINNLDQKQSIFF